MASTTPSIKAQADSTTTQQPTTDEKVHAASAAFNHFSQGKRHLLVGDFKSAVTAFKEATESLVELYGEQVPECGDAYYHYGRALLELVRKEAGVLGPDLDGASSRVYCLVIVLTCWSVHSQECLGNENKRSYGCLKMHLLRAEYTRKLVCLGNE
ncbi:histone-binding protein N1/N2-like [Scylla paramamosain]|uniref:histone-binding protein N1/N2-like n=1 Tax=Scylla paramamosain TaxID=85552 RepID=UPI003082EDB4